MTDESKREYLWLGQFTSTNQLQPRVLTINPHASYVRLLIALPPAGQRESREHSGANVTSLGFIPAAKPESQVTHRRNSITRGAINCPGRKSEDPGCGYWFSAHYHKEVSVM
ncbi:hypothetical protein EV401DRAFT_2195422 [Pisolithus croceorrhizus]|nr:hypothetical protein EV401DRAFT_2195422 [Pisolithus croceorrhizus]